MIKKLLNRETNGPSLGFCNEELYRKYLDTQMLTTDLIEEFGTRPIPSNLTCSVEICDDSSKMLQLYYNGIFFIRKNYESLSYGNRVGGPPPISLPVLVTGHISGNGGGNGYLTANWMARSSSMISTGSSFCPIKVWNIGNNGHLEEVDRTVKFFDLHINSKIDVSLIAVAGERNGNASKFGIQVFDLRTSLKIPKIQQQMSANTPTTSNCNNRSREIRCMAWKPDDVMRISTVSRVGCQSAYTANKVELEEWDLRMMGENPVQLYGSIATRYDSLKYVKACIKYSPDGRYIFWYSSTGFFGKYDTFTGKEEGMVNLQSSRFFANHEFAMTYKSTPELAFVPDTSNVKIVDLRKFAVVKEIDLVQPQSGVVVDELRQTLYFYGEGITLFTRLPASEVS